MIMTWKEHIGAGVGRYIAITNSDASGIMYRCWPNGSAEKGYFSGRGRPGSWRKASQDEWLNACRKVEEVYKR
jgi:hypothetical protein